MSSSAWSLNYEVRCYFSYSAVEPCAIAITKKLDACYLLLALRKSAQTMDFSPGQKKSSFSKTGL